MRPCPYYSIVMECLRPWYLTAQKTNAKETLRGNFARLIAMQDRLNPTLHGIFLYCSLLVPCTTLEPLSLSFNSVPEKFKSYLGIQYGTFLLRKKKIVLLYVRRVVSISSIFRKNWEVMAKVTHRGRLLLRISPPYCIIPTVTFTI